jgi:hypothetical protein
VTTLRERTSTVALRLAVGVAVAVAGLVPAGARGSGAATAAAMTLARVPASVQPGGDLDLRLRVSHATPDMVLRVSVHSAITSRTAFADTIAGHDPGDVVDDVSIPVAFLPRTRAGDTRVPVGLQDPDARRDVNRLAVDRTGVYPLTISLSPPAADPVATIDTWLVVAERALTTPLSFAWVWQLVGTPLTSANRAEVQATVESDGRLGRIAQALRAADGVPLSLVLGPETFATWATIAAKDDKAAGIETVRRSVANGTSRQVLATPYVPLDIPALESARLAGDVVRDLQVGTDTIESVLGVLPDPRTVLLDPIDEGALAIARNAFAQRTVVREQAVRPVAHRLTPARPFDIAAGARTYPAAASNAFVARLLAGAGPPAERAQRFLAGLSLIALEAPSSPRGIVVATPTKWNPDPKLVLLVLKGLRGHPLVRATTLDGYFALPRDTNDDGTPIVTSLLPIRPNPPTVTPSQLAAANESLASFRSLVGNDDARVKQGAHSILIAPSSALDRGDAARELATIDNAARRFLESIATTGRRTITLTSRTARVPLSFSNRTGQTVRVRVHLVSSKLRFPDGSEHVLDLPPRNTTRRFLVEARTSGTFTMRVTLTTADNQFTIATTEMTVRSTVFSSIGVLLTVGALAFLAIWWGNHIRRSRRARRAAAATTPAQ